MERDDSEAMAAEFVLGTLDAAERSRFLAALNDDPALGRLVADWERRLAPLCDALPPMDAPADLLSGIETRIARPGLPDTTTIRAAEGSWRAMAPGVESKLLWRNAALGRQSMLVRVAPGCTYDTHHHAGDEECLVLEGDLRFGDLQLRAGDYHLAHEGGKHPVATSNAGCLLYINTVWHPA